MLVLTSRSTKHQLDVIRDVEFQSSAKVSIHYLNLIQQRIQDERHVIKQTFFTGFITLIPSQSTGTHH